MSTPLDSSTSIPRHCIHCGRSDTEVKFRSTRALKCVQCDKDTTAARKDYHKDYHAARGRAMRLLIDRYPEEWDRLLAQEHEAVKKERGH